LKGKGKMQVKTAVILRGLLFFCILVILAGCDLGVESVAPRDGRVYVLNNCRPSPTPRGHRFTIFVRLIYEGGNYVLPFHVDYEGNIVPGVEPFDLTFGGDPFPGGTVVEFRLEMGIWAGTAVKDVSVEVDGDMTVEVHEEDWQDGRALPTYRIISGRYTGKPPM